MTDSPSRSGDDVITVRRLRKAYPGSRRRTVAANGDTTAVNRRGDTMAVDGLDLDVRRGEVLALLGPNGAGKSTTVEILEGHRTRDSGEVSVLGTDPARAGRSWRARIGIVLQSSGDTAELTVTEVVRHFTIYYDRHRDPEETIDLVGLTDKRNARVGRLSGGQRRRLDVALGIVGLPELLFLDEPTTGFDPEARRAFWALIQRLATEGTTILLTTHYLEEAEVLADRVAVIDRGRVLEVATPATLGGRSSGEITVRWSGPDGPMEQRTATPTRLIAELAAAHDGGEIPDLSVARPTLEDVYLQMTGAHR